MEILKKIKKSFLDYRKKRYIYKELKKKFAQANREDKNYLKTLTNSIFKSSKFVDWSIRENVKAIELNKEKQLMTDIKVVIDKHYKERERKLREEQSDIDRKKKNIENKEKTLNTRKKK